MGQALLGIGAGAAGAFGPAYDAARKNRQQSQLGDIDIQSAKDTMEGQAAWANAAKLAGLQGASALQGVGGGGQPGQGPPGMPGAPQSPPGVQLQGGRFVPPQGPPMPQMRGSMMPMPQGMPQGAPQLGAPPAPGMVNPGRIGNQPQNLTGPAIMPQQAPSAGLTPAAAPGGAGPPSSSPVPPGGLRGREQLDPMMQGRGSMSQPTHMMTAPQMAQWIAQHNPSLSPGALAKAVEFGMKQAIPENRIAYLEQQLQQKSLEAALTRESREHEGELGRESRERIAAGGQSGDQYESQIRAVLKGDAALPSPNSRAPGAQYIRNEVFRRNPNFDEKTYAGERAGEVAGGRARGGAESQADAGSLKRLVAQSDAIDAFSSTATRVGKVLSTLADKVDTTGSPVVERWIRAGRKDVAGDVDVTKFNAQMQLYRAEVAKILTNPNLTGVLTNHAQQEVEQFLSGGSSAKQIKGLIELLENDFALRKKETDKKVNEIKGRLKGGSKQETSQPTLPDGWSVQEH
jgi:hypothetical protein